MDATFSFALSIVYSKSWLESSTVKTSGQTICGSSSERLYMGRWTSRERSVDSCPIELARTESVGLHPHRCTKPHSRRREVLNFVLRERKKVLPNECKHDWRINDPFDLAQPWRKRINTRVVFSLSLAHKTRVVCHRFSFEQRSLDSQSWLPSRVQRKKQPYRSYRMLNVKWSIEFIRISRTMNRTNSISSTKRPRPSATSIRVRSKPTALPMTAVKSTWCTTKPVSKSFVALRRNLFFVFDWRIIRRWRNRRSHPSSDNAGRLQIVGTNGEEFR